MKYVRKFFLFIASSLLVSLLVSTATFWTLNNTVGNRETVKNWFESSGAYDNFIGEVVAATAEQTSEEDDVASIDADTLSRAAQKAFPADFLQTTLEQAIDSGYNWLEQDTPMLELSIDFSDAKTAFADALGDEVIAKAQSLPTCSFTEIPSELDVFSASCLPPNADVQELAQQFRDDIANSEELLPDPVVDAADIKIESDGEEKRIDEAFSQAPDWYRIATSLAWIFSGLALVAGAAVIFLAANRRKGLLHTTKSLAVAAASIAVFALISKNAPLDFGGVGGGDEASQGFSERIIVPFLEQAIDSFANWNLVFAIGYGVTTLAILISLFFTRKRKPAEPETPAPSDEKSAHESKSAQPPTDENAHANPEQAPKKQTVGSSDSQPEVPAKTNTTHTKIPHKK